MRSLAFLTFMPAAALVSGVLGAGCSSSPQTGFGGDGGSSASSGVGISFNVSSSMRLGTSASSVAPLHGPDSGQATSAGPTVTTIYADTDTELYTLDPSNDTVALVGKFAGFVNGESATDCAVNAEGEVYINSELSIYKATLPASPGTVALTKVATIAAGKSQYFYALAFAPAGVLGAGETLVGGDNAGELWAIDPTTGAIKDLGSFGTNPSHPNDTLALSGDIVFYTDAAGNPTGLATIRSCPPGKNSYCTTTDDYLAGIDMQALQTAYTSGQPASSLLGGIYGGGTGSVGAGTGFGEIFGLGAWQGTVYGFTHASPGQLLTIGASGVASPVSSTSPSSGWAGAGVSTKTTITVIAPPPVK